MIEFFRHFFGICGEHWHPNIVHVLVGGVSMSSLLLWVRSKFMVLEASDEDDCNLPH